MVQLVSVPERIYPLCFVLSVSDFEELLSPGDLTSTGVLPSTFEKLPIC